MAGQEVAILRRFLAHLGDNFIELAADCPIGLACFAFHFLDVAKDGYIYDSSANVFTSLCE
jgi:hypothetical protein